MPRVPLIIVVLGVVAAATGVVQISAVVFLLILAGFTGLASVLADRHRGR
ncbi:MAG: hypothetical protein VX889_04765 [Actinomycetota bacterium]|nr:hypothetical protein [Actinomycetota bacterium]